MTAPIRSMPELVAALRARRDELQLTHETIDAIANWPAGYAGKLLAPEPIKNLGWMSLGLALDTLGIALVVVENEEQIKRVEKRWTRRERPKNAPLLAAALSIEEIAREEFRQHMRQLGSKGGKMGGSKGGKRRLRTMKKRERQRIASHAARARWSKRHA